MPNIAAALKSEISRIARKELRGELVPLQKASSRYRSQIADLRRQLQALERQIRRAGGRQQPKTNSSENGSEESASSLRFSAKGLAAHRQRLGLSAADFSKLLGVSALSVYNWESGKTRPRQSQLAKIAAVRAMGKREALAKLADA